MFSKTPIILTALLLSVSNLSIFLKAWCSKLYTAFQMKSHQCSREQNNYFLLLLQHYPELDVTSLQWYSIIASYCLKYRFLFFFPLYGLSTGEVSLLNEFFFTGFQIIYFRLKTEITNQVMIRKAYRAKQI